MQWWYASPQNLEWGTNVNCHPWIILMVCLAAAYSTDCRRLLWAESFVHQYICCFWLPQYCIDWMITNGKYDITECKNTTNFLLLLCFVMSVLQSLCLNCSVDIYGVVCSGCRLSHYAVIRGTHGFRIDVDNRVMFIFSCFTGCVNHLLLWLDYFLV